jgi:hypothetical protein
MLWTSRCSERRGAFRKGFPHNVTEDFQARVGRFRWTDHILYTGVMCYDSAHIEEVWILARKGESKELFSLTFTTFTSSIAWITGIPAQRTADRWTSDNVTEGNSAERKSAGWATVWTREVMCYENAHIEEVRYLALRGESEVLFSLTFTLSA